MSYLRLSDLHIEQPIIAGQGAPIVALNAGMSDMSDVSESTKAVYGTLALASSGIGFYHGYLRNNGSVGWGLVWALAGSAFPVITPALAFAQGIGKPAA